MCLLHSFLYYVSARPSLVQLTPFLSVETLLPIRFGTSYRSSYDTLLTLLFTGVVFLVLDVSGAHPFRRLSSVRPYLKPFLPSPSPDSFTSQNTVTIVDSQVWSVKTLIFRENF